MTHFLHCITEFRKKNARKKVVVSKGKEDEPKKKRKLEGESSDKGEGSEKGEDNDKGEDSDKGVSNAGPLKTPTCEN